MNTLAVLPVYSMTGFARIAGRVMDGEAESGTWTLSLKSVNHRFLDLHLRLPGNLEGLELELRRRLKNQVLRGHLELTLTFDRTSRNNGVHYDRELVAEYVAAFRSAQQEYGFALDQQPDLNTILRLPGVFAASQGHGGSADRREDREAVAEALQAAVLGQMDMLVAQLNTMRRTEGAALTEVLRRALEQLERSVQTATELRSRVQDAYVQRLQERMTGLLAGVSKESRVDDGRLLQEAALLADRSDVEEEIARLVVHIGHFRALLSAGGELGKKLDFLLQEMNREANTLLSKSAGIPGEGARITELGLGMKSAIEKLREQVQNLE